jgi:hypothetical protein
MKMKQILACTSVLALTAMAACTPTGKTEQKPNVENVTTPTVEDARAFLNKAEAELAQLSKETAPVYWAQATNITDETIKLLLKPVHVSRRLPLITPIRPNSSKMLICRLIWRGKCSACSLD